MNSVIITRGQVGVWSKYGGVIVNSTIIGSPEAPSKPIFGVVVWNPRGINGVLFALVNTAVFGFRYAAGFDGHYNQDIWSSASSNNATDSLASIDDSTLILTKSGAGPLICGDTCPYKPAILPGQRNIFGVPFETSSGARFVNKRDDFRIDTRSALARRGVALRQVWPSRDSEMNIEPYAGHGSIFTQQPWARADIIGTPRSQMRGYDIGAWQAGDTAPRNSEGNARQ
jgi:hypothetical protein